MTSSMSLYVALTTLVIHAMLVYLLLPPLSRHYKGASTSWFTILHFGLQGLLYLTALRDSTPFDLSFFECVIATDTALYISLSFFCPRPKNDRDYYHHLVCAVVLLMFNLEMFLFTPTESMSLVVETSGKIFFWNSRGVLFLLLLPDKLHILPLIYLVILRLAYHPYIWLTHLNLWSWWHHIAHITAMLFVLQEVLRFMRGNGFSTSERNMLYQLVSFLYMQRLHILSDEEISSGVAARVMKESNVKGNYLERLHSLPSWSPIISVESVDGQRYQRLIAATHLVMTETSISNRCEAVAKRLALTEHEQRNGLTDLDAPTMQRFAAKVMHELLFREEPDEHALVVWTAAANTLAGTLAAKRVVDVRHKRTVRNALELATSLAQKHSWYHKIKLQDQAERVSSFLQPMLISPIINLVDAVVAIHENIDQLEETAGEGSFSSKLIEILALNPPFPVLERWSEKDQCQYVINSDEYSRRMRDMRTFNSKSNGCGDDGDHKIMLRRSHFLVFGIGDRQCPGKTVALRILVQIVKHLLLPSVRDGVHVTIKETHAYSGRHNDSAADTNYYTQLVTVVRVVGQVLRRSG